MKKRTLKEALEVCIRKWDYVVEHELRYDDHEHMRDLPEEIYDLIRKDTAYCPLCTLFYHKKGCGKCPLVVKGSTCIDGGHPFDLYSMSNGIIYAKQILDILKEALKELLIKEFSLSVSFSEEDGVYVAECKTQITKSDYEILKTHGNTEKEAIDELIKVIDFVEEDKNE